jgi:hypothetical protein
MSLTPTSPPLDELLRCQYFAKNLAVRACLRRQVERQESTKPGVEGPPVKAYCASGRCELGNRIRAGHPGAHACPTCGTGLVGVDACPTCAARAADAGVPRVLPAKPALSTRIWAPGHIEPDFVPPTAERSPTAHIHPGRVAAAAPTTASGEGRGPAGRTGNADPSPAPTSTTRRDPMACPECNSKTMHRRNCSRRPGGPNGKSAAGEKKSAAPNGAPTRDHDMETATVDDLLIQIQSCEVRISACRTELQRRKEAIERALGDAA